MIGRLKHSGHDIKRSKPGLAALALLYVAAMSLPARADELKIEVTGLKEPILTAVSNNVDAHNITGNSKLTEARLQRSAEQAELEAALSLRPYGYYQPEIHSTLKPRGDGNWLLEMNVDPGPPIVVATADIGVSGPGAELDDLRRWKKNFPLKTGSVLDQSVWEEQKQSALELAEADGYLSATFTRHIMEVDLEQREARLELQLETGPQAVMGTIEFRQDVIDPGFLELLPRFKAGQPYDAFLLENFRLDIWRTGYFKEVDVMEERRLEESPPVVNLVVTATERNRNTYQGSLGFGTDTEFRAQLLWTRHLLSKRGDSLDTGVGWQQRFDQYSFKTSYRLPRRVKEREFWIADLGIRKENQDFEVKANDDDPDFIKLTNGDVIDYSFKAGKLIVRDLSRGYQQLFETWYAQYVLEKSTFNLNDFIETGTVDPNVQNDLSQFRNTDSSLALGVNWDWPVVRGSGFRSTGHHERAWIFTANSVWGSEREFTQAYLSSNWSLLLARRWKLMLRGEAAYSDANTQQLEIDVDGQLLQLSVTDLPSLYRFKAGGSRSVRGYAFESLSNNGIGSNNIITASAEVEWNFRPDWSLATFYDVGNAFNDWGETNLKHGAGVGIRWYSIAGPVRLDFAQALSYDGDPWRIHFTIGTPLL